jgi:Uma2 family endonuclease
MRSRARRRLPSLAQTSKATSSRLPSAWYAASRRRCLAPDGFVKLGVPRDVLDSWKTWERGVPELCVEILSPSDSKEKPG